MPENTTCILPDPENSALNTPSEAQLQAITMKRIQNKQKSINKLPPEVLSRIFRLGEEEERYTRSRNFTYLGLQDLAAQVCSHWRSVAIGDPSLWTYIHITRPSPHELAYLYLSRAGSTSLVDIDIEIRSRYWNNEPWTNYNDDSRIYQLENMIAMLSANGANVNRWRSLSVCVKRPNLLLKFVQFLEKQSAPALRFLSFKWKIGPHAPGEQREKDIARYFGFLLREDSYSRLSKRSAPNLRCIELTHIPWGFFSAPSLLPYTGLTSLSLTAAYAIHDTSKLCNLLSANPLLESLSLNTGFAHVADVPPTERISLPTLRSFSISTWEVASWVLGMLKMIDAPMLHSLSISTFVRSNNGGNGPIANYLATGSSPDDAVTSPSTPVQLYPSLRQLDIALFDCTQSEIASIFASFPSITHLSVLGHQAELLDAPQLLLPELVCLKFLHIVCSDLGGILRRRAKVGHPIKTVVLQSNWRMKLGTEIPSSVHVKLYPEPKAEVNTYESEEEEYCSSDEDEEFNDEVTDYDEEEGWGDEDGDQF